MVGIVQQPQSENRNGSLAAITIYVCVGSVWDPGMECIVVNNLHLLQVIHMQAVKGDTLI